MAVAEGFNGLGKGQVRFARRQIEMALGIGSTKALALIAQAKTDGFLVPTQQFGRRKGEGEIYETLGSLREARIAPEKRKPTTNQQQTNNKPTNSLDGLELFDATNQQQTNNKPTTNRLKDQTLNTITYPSRAKGKGTVEELKKEGLRDILKWDNQDWYDVFFEVFKPFPKEKKLNMVTLAKQFRSTLQAGETDAERLYAAAQELSNSRQPQYLPDASKWMNEQGWRAYAAG